MGTFHQAQGELHGITVVVDTFGARVFVGRCDTVTPEGVVLLDGDVHEETPGGPTKDEWVRKAARVGAWKSFDREVVPAGEVSSIRRLGDVGPG